LADYCGTEFAVGCASGSDALLLAMMALGIGPGDDVVLPSYTFFATASCITRLGARPVFVDILPATYNLDPSAVEAAVTPSTKAILPVHLYGQCAEMDALARIAARHDLPLVEDAAQAIGAEFGGRRAGNLGKAGCFSLYPTKNLGAMGDAGIVTTSDPVFADRIRMLGSHGMRPRYHHRMVGINSRLDSIQAAVLRVKLPHLDSWIDGRTENAQRYGQLFAEEGLADLIGLPQGGGGRHVWNQYVIRIPNGRRDSLRAHLTAAGVGTEIYYPVPLHRQLCYAGLGYPLGSLPETERAAAETLALPIFPELTVDEQATVVRSIAKFFAARRWQAA
jgi:dTDP-4-amino-4,6-dideoxygalactose transaminase